MFPNTEFIALLFLKVQQNKGAQLISLLNRKALEWSTDVWMNKDGIMQSYGQFHNVFHHCPDGTKLTFHDQQLSLL